jgi:hypothetical protein
VRGGDKERTTRGSQRHAGKPALPCYCSASTTLTEDRLGSRREHAETVESAIGNILESPETQVAQTAKARRMLAELQLLMRYVDA